MGILQRLRTATEADRFLTNQASRAIASPFAGPSHLSPAVAIDDIFGLRPGGLVTRSQAMSIPAVARGRHLIADVLARQPLKAYNKDGMLSEQPTWLYRSVYYPPRLRVLWTIDDLIFEGWSLWILDRGAPDQSGRRPILDAMRVDPTRWRQDQGQIYITIGATEYAIADGDYILFPGPAEGLRTIAARTILGALKLEEQWLARVKNPIPITEIRYTGEEDLEPEEMRDIRTKYLEARNDEDGIVMVTPRGFEVHAHGDQALNLFVEGRNAVAGDMARFLNLPMTMLDASQTNGSSVDYENNGIGRSSYYDLSLRSWALPIEEALSQDDVGPRGQYVQFDLTDLTTTPDTGTGPALED